MSLPSVTMSLSSAPHSPASVVRRNCSAMACGLLLDRWEPGSHCNSACLAPLHTIEQYGAADSILETYDHHDSHAGWRRHMATSRVRLHLRLPPLLQAMLRHTPIEFRQVRVINLEQDTLVTSEGRLWANTYVDASGWRAVLANSVEPTYWESVPPSGRRCGNRVGLSD